MTLGKSARLPRDLREEAVFLVLQTARVSKFIEIVYYIETRLRLTQTFYCMLIGTAKSVKAYCKLSAVLDDGE